MSKKRKQYSAAFKAKVALAAYKGDQTIAELAARHQIHPTMINTWKRELMSNAAEIFEGKGNRKRGNQGEVDNLYRQIGQRWNAIF